jgi:MFS family permease
MMARRRRPGWATRVSSLEVPSGRRPIEVHVTEQRRSLWRHPDFLRLWTAETVSQVGTQVTQLALPLVAIVVLVATPFEVALLGTVAFLPFILLGLPAGVWVDRLRRRPILIAGDLGRAVLLASIPVAFVLGVLTIWQLYVVAFLVGSLTVFFDVAYQSYLPSLVEREDLVDGNAKLEISRSGAALVGPSLGGILVEWLTAPVAILVDSVSYVGSALFIFLIRRHEPEPVHPDVEAGGERPSMRSDIAQGIRYVAGHRQLRLIALSTGTSNFFNQLVFALLLVYAVRELGMSAGVIGVVFAIGNLGFLAAAVTATRLQRRMGLGPAIILGGAVSTVAVFLVPLATPATAAPLLIVEGVLAGFGMVVYNVNQVSFRQAITPERMQGRMNATMRFIVWGTIPIGSIIGGALGTTIGILPTIWIGAIGGLLGMVPLLLQPVRSLRALPASPEEYDASEAAQRAGGIGPVVSTESAVEIEERAEIVERAEHKEP